MAVDISGGEDSLYWKAGIDTTDFDQGMERLTGKIMESTKNQLQVQQQAAQSQKLVAQQILQSAGAIKGVDSAVAAQVRNLLSYQHGVQKIGSEMAATTEDLQRQIQGLKGQTIELKAKGLDTAALTASLDKVEAEVEKINATPLDIATGKVDVEPLLSALRQVQAEYDKLQTDPIKLGVDTSGLQPVSPVFMQASVDAFKQVQPAIVEAIRNFKTFQQVGQEALTSVGDQVEKLSREELQIRVGGVNTQSVEKAFEGLQRRFEGLNNTALVLKVKGVDTASLTSAIDKARSEFETLKGLTLSPDLDITEFQQQYKKLQASLTALESEKIQLRAEGVDTSKLERDIKNIRIQMAGLSRESLRVTVDGASLESLESQLAALKKQSLDLDFKGVDTAPVLGELEKIEAQIEKIKRKPVEVRTGTVNLGPLSSALIKVGDEIDAISAQPLVVKADASGLQDIATHADHAAHALHEMGEASQAALKGGALTQQQLADALKNVRAAGKNAKEEYQQLNTAFHSIFHGKSGSESLGAQWTNGIKQGTVSIGEFIASLKLTDAQLATLPEKLEKAGYVAKGTFTAMAAGVDQVDKAVAKVQGRIMTLESAARAAGGGVQAFDPKALGITDFINELKGTPVEIPVQVKIGSLTEKTQELERLKQQFSDLSEIDRNSDIGKGLVQNIQQVERELQDINGAFLKVEQHAAGSLNEKVATLNKLKEQYAALSEVDRRSTAGRQLAQNIHGLDRDVANINKEFERTNSLAQQAATALGAYFSIQAATGLVQDLVRVRGEFQQLEVAFTTMLQSKEKADQLLAQVTELAATTPFELKEVAGGAKQLLAYGFAADEVIGVLKRMGDIAAGTGTDIDGLIRALGQVKTKGKLQSEEMFQFAERGVPIIRELSKQMGVAESEVQKLVEQGKVGFKEVYAALSGLTGQGGLFFNMMEAQSKTLTGQLSNLRDSWNGMLNELGRSNEGVLSGGIRAAAALVNNYQKVLDILGMLIFTYGSYRAALMVSTVASAGLTAAETLHYARLVLVEKAQKLLNATMLANPYVLVGTLIGALVAKMVFFREKTLEVKSAQELLAGAQKQVGDRMAEARAKIQPYVEALQNANLSEQQRVDIYNKLREVDPKIVEGLDAKTLSYQNLKTNVDKYLQSLREQIRLEANQAASVESIKQEEALKQKIDDLIDKRNKAQKRLKEIENDASASTARIGISSNIQQLTMDIVNTMKLLDQQQSVTESLGGKIVQSEVKNATATQAAKERTVDVIDAEISALKKEQSAVSDTSKEWEEYVAKIKALEEERKRITGDTKAAKTQETLENKINALLEQRRSILEAISDAQAKANQSGMTRQASEVDKINERYDDLIDKVSKYQRAVDTWNKRNPKNPVQGIGQQDLARIEAARQLEISNQLMKEDVEKYRKSLEEKSDLFKRYQQTVQEVGKSDADKLYADEKLAFDSYLDYLKSELGKLGTKISLGLDLNLADQSKLKALTEELKKASKEQADQQVEDTKRVMVATLNAAEQRKRIEVNYLKEVDILRKTYKGQELEERERVLKEALDNDLRSLAQHLGEQSELYRRMNAGVYKMANDRINNEIALLEKQLSQIEDKDPGLAKAIREAIEEWKKLVRLMNGTPDTLELIEMGAEKIGPAFADLAQSVEGLNAGLADSLRLVADLASGVTKAAASYKVFKEAQNTKGVAGVLGQISGGLGMISAAVGVISLIDSVVSKAQERKQQQYLAEKQRQVDIIRGEAEINQLYRERERSQVLINKLRIEGLEAERRLLEEQKKQVDSQAAQVLAKLATEYQKGYNPVLNPVVLPTGQTYQEAMSLAGKTFEELEKLAAQNLLNDRSLQLFETLKKLKEEGADIDRMLQDAKKAAQELFTGTTQESIADSIIEGLKQGKRGIKDFADTFQELMQGALLNALKYQALEAPLKAFYEQFAVLSQSGGALTAAEIEELRRMYATIIENAQAQFDQIQQVAGVKFTGSGSSPNSLQGSLQALTEKTGELLAGQVGGIRLTALEHLRVAYTTLSELNRIQQNTALAAKTMADVFRILNGAASGNNPLHVKPR